MHTVSWRSPEYVCRPLTALVRRWLDVRELGLGSKRNARQDVLFRDCGRELKDPLANGPG